MAADERFGPQTLPYGIALQRERASVVSRIGDTMIDLAPLARILAPDLEHWLDRPTLNPLLAAGPAVWAEVRTALGEWVADPRLRRYLEPHLHPLDAASLLLPFEVADYVDFYASRQHAENVGAILRPGQDRLPHNWLHLPVGYHGRAGTVVVSGTEVIRPRGQLDRLRFGPTAKLDFEAEVGFVVGVGSRLGEPVPTERFADHVFGVVLVNDWSARDIQSFEYVPLGPFLAKSFATSVSAWVTPLAALDQAWIRPPERRRAVHRYLDEGDRCTGLDLTLSIELNGSVISRPEFREMYWSPSQQLAHLTVNGASIRTGDLFASGTVSGSVRAQFGSLLELHADRAYLDDGDEVTIRATALGGVDFGEVRGRVRAAM